MAAQRTGFRPATDGFAFVNAWRFDERETADMGKTLSYSVDRMTGALPASMRGLVGNSAGTLVRTWTQNLIPEEYGMCGGMAFAALDYHKQGIPVPRGGIFDQQPQRTDPQGGKLRAYLWQRQVESFQANAPQMLAWMAMLHMPLLGGGAGWLLQQTRTEWHTLKQHIDAGNPHPLCLLGTTANPFNNHQVLATGYADPGDGTGTIFLYDMNCPRREQTIALDMRQSDHLRATESCPSPPRGDLRGFFCETYTPATPPTFASAVQASGSARAGHTDDTPPPDQPTATPRKKQQ